MSSESTSRVVLVTGASRGIGKAIALGLASHGAVVAGTATSEQGAQAIGDYLSEHNGQGFVMDVTSPESVEAALARIKETLGDPLVLINNAGITRDNLLMRMKADEWNDIITTNLNAVFHLSRLCIKAMVKARYGRIITISSVVGVTGNAGQCNYAAAKAGVIGFSKALAREVGARNITVNTVAPGFIDTDMTRALSDQQRKHLLGDIPLNRLGQVEEVAAAVRFLASEQAGYITGHTLHINGGMYMA